MSGVLGPDRTGHLDHRPVRGRRRQHPRRDRRPGPIHLRPRAGQARRPGTPAEELRQLHRPHPDHRARTPGAAPGRLARGLGRAEIQPRLRRPARAPDQPRAQQALHRAGTRRPGRRAAAAPACHHHHRPAVGPRHRGRRAARPDPDRRLTPRYRRPVELAAGASPTRHRDLWISAHILGSPARRHANPITRCRAPSP